MLKTSKQIILISALALLLLIVVPGTANAESLIREFEVGSATAVPSRKAIPDTNGKWQIGFGSTWNYDENRWVNSSDIITDEQAYRWMRLEIAEKQSLIKSLVIVPLTSNQFIALTSFVYNIGSTAFTDSTLLQLLNQGRYTDAADQFARWKYSDGIILPGLVARRERERELFVS